MALPFSVRQVYGGLEQALEDSGFAREDNDEISSKRGVEQTPAAAALQKSINSFFRRMRIPVRAEVESFDEAQVDRLQSDQEPNRFVIGASAGLDDTGRGVIYISTVAAEEDFDVGLVDPKAIAKNAATVIRHELMHDRQYTSLASRMGISRAEAKQKFEEWGLIPDDGRPRTDYLGSHIEIDAFGHEFAERLAQKFGIERAERMVATADTGEMQRLADEASGEMGKNFAEFYREHPQEKFTGRLQKKIRKYLKAFRDEGVYEGRNAGAQILRDMTKQSPGHAAPAAGSSFPFKEGRLSPDRLLREFSRDVASDELVWHRDREDRAVRTLEGRGWALQVDGGMPIPLRLGESHHIPAGTWHRLLRRPDATTLRLIIELKKGDRVQHKGKEATVKVPDARGDLVGIDPAGPDDIEMVSGDELEPLREKDKPAPRPRTYGAPEGSKRDKQLDATAADLKSGDPEREERAWRRRERMEKKEREKPGWKNRPRADTKTESAIAITESDLSAIIQGLLEEELSKKLKATLRKKAEERGLTPGSLEAEYKKGLAAWGTSGSRKGISQHAWAMARVNAATPSKSWATVKKSRAKKKKKKG
jgi:hypothetical protein